MTPIRCVQVQPAYILYAKPFRETSLLLEVFSRDYGRVSLVARGARGSLGSGQGRPRKSRPRFSVLLQPFVPLLLSWRGRGPLFNLTHAEPNGVSPALAGRLLLGGWYMNELIVRTLKHWDSHVQLFIAYQASLFGLNSSLPLSLRQFERSLLTGLGVVPQLDREKTELAVQPHAWYVFCPVSGLSRVTSGESNVGNCFQGAVLLAVQNADWQHQIYWSSMKRLFRIMLDYVLLDQPMRSRDLL
jgi:DNA repair protein RecO (recombination protein O)